MAVPDAPLSSSWGRRLSFGQALVQAFAIVLAHMDVFTAITACQVLPLLASVALFTMNKTNHDSNDDPHKNTTTIGMYTFLSNSTNNDDNSNDNSSASAWAAMALLLVATLLQLLSFLLYIVCTGAIIHAAGTAVAVNSLGVLEEEEEEEEANRRVLVAESSPAFVSSMRRGWKRACPLVGGMVVTTVLILVLECLPLFLLNYSKPPMIASVLFILASVGVLAYAVAGAVCIRPAIVWGRQGVLAAIRQSFALAAGKQWYILCLQLSAALVEGLFLIALWTLLGDFALMVILGGEMTMLAVTVVGGTVMVLFCLLSPAFSLVYVSKSIAL